MTLYLVERNGAYQQGVVGIYDSLVNANAAAEIAKSLEPDDYHTFSVTEIELNGDPKSLYKE